jgi:hypothetical protein
VGQQPIGRPAADRWARREFNQELKQKNTRKNKGVLEKNLLTLNKEKKLLSTLQK